MVPGQDKGALGRSRRLGEQNQPISTQEGESKERNELDRGSKGRAIKKLPEDNIRSYVQELKFRRDRFKGHGKSKITENILKEKL